MNQEAGEQCRLVEARRDMFPAKAANGPAAVTRCQPDDSQMTAVTADWRPSVSDASTEGISVPIS